MHLPLANWDVNGEFELDYDYLLISLGARPKTFNTPGVSEHCHFLKVYCFINVWKEIKDAQRIRRSVMNCFERASLPNLSEEERKKSLHFVVISGGPTGVEFFAKLHDFVQEDLSKLYHNALELVKISLIEAGEHILTMFDKKITQFTEEKFQWDGIDVKTNIKVVKVHGDSITMTNSSTGEVNIPYGMAIWSTGFGTRLIILGFMKQIDQGNMRVLETVEWLRVLGCENIYALGDFSIISQQKVMA
ncbi:external alternative NAD(P)H-ubiquinone oxidoreductase B3, mitochondrial-like [Dendrobium catenatum]|uniref:external alternative NAD(P)H-ubiquinone oxidoreductase B3, mitochondrial-like n=1 Tax=Dendrobium catenatum TaxID=906689 RepID=UPI00109F0DA2|nr:external alternative NAD(P)H-ubiquinone oxidoreductase B3, mitochondrial-like [Dendrobium catenatum]